MFQPWIWSKFHVRLQVKIHHFWHSYSFDWLILLFLFMRSPDGYKLTTETWLAVSLRRRVKLRTTRVYGRNPYHYIPMVEIRAEKALWRTCHKASINNIYITKIIDKKMEVSREGIELQRNMDIIRSKETKGGQREF